MKLVLLLISIFYLNGCSKAVDINIPKHERSNFQTIWNQVASDPYDTLPQKRVSYSKLSKIESDSKRTLESHSDILAPFEKLAHPNGICFKGIWEIDQQNQYSGYFKKGSKALIITRLSSALSNTKQGELRAFGFAGKIFPTLDPLLINKENTASFFLIDDLGGTKAKHFTDVSLTNAPKSTITLDVLKNFLYAIKVASTFSKADKNPTIRQQYEVSYLGENNTSNVITPKWMKLEAQAGGSNDAKDFRDELQIKDGQKLIFNIFVSKDQKNWQNIGTITLDTSVASNSCDHRLHFHHPKWRSDLNFGGAKAPITKEK